MVKKLEIKATEKKSIFRDHLHNTLLPKYTKISNKWFCRVCGADVTDVPLLAITYKRIK